MIIEQKISILELFQKDHMKTGVMLLKIQLCITGADYILNKMYIEISYFKL